MILYNTQVIKQTLYGQDTCIILSCYIGFQHKELVTITLSNISMGDVTQAYFLFAVLRSIVHVSCINELVFIRRLPRI